MKRSRVTFAITDAAAIAALVASPPTTGRCSKPVGGTGKPSERQSSPTRHAAQRVRSAARFVLCSPRSSIPRTQRDVTATGVAARSTRGYSVSRISSVCCLESLSARQRPQVGQRQPLVVEQHRGGDQRAGEAAAAGLVGAGHEARAERRGRSGTAGCRWTAAGARARRIARGARSAWAASRWRRLRR